MIEIIFDVGAELLLLVCTWALLMVFYGFFNYSCCNQMVNIWHMPSSIIKTIKYFCSNNIMLLSQQTTQSYNTSCFISWVFPRALLIISLIPIVFLPFSLGFQETVLYQKYYFFQKTQYGLFWIYIFLILYPLLRILFDIVSGDKAMVHNGLSQISRFLYFAIPLFVVFLSIFIVNQSSDLGVILKNQLMLSSKHSIYWGLLKQPLGGMIFLYYALTVGGLFNHKYSGLFNKTLKTGHYLVTGVDAFYYRMSAHCYTMFWVLLIIFLYLGGTDIPLRSVGIYNIIMAIAGFVLKGIAVIILAFVVRRAFYKMKLIGPVEYYWKLVLLLCLCDLGMITTMTYLGL